VKVWHAFNFTLLYLTNQIEVFTVGRAFQSLSPAVQQRGGEGALCEDGSVAPCARLVVGV